MWKIAHQTTRATKLVELAISARVTTERIDPTRNQGRRRPRRDVVRSLSAPAMGLVMTAARAPTTVAMVRFANLFATLKATICVGKRIWLIVNMISQMTRVASDKSTSNPALTDLVGTCRVSI